MKALKSCVLLLISGLVFCGAENDYTSTTTPATSTTTTPTTEPPTTSTTNAPTTKSTTTPPHTTTTEAPITTSAPTTTSTPEPPKPTTPVPEPDVGSWVFTNKTTNETCVLTQMALQLNVTYVNTSNNLVHTLYDIPKDAQVLNGSCSKDVQYILLGYPVSALQVMVNISFTRNATEFYLSGLHVILNIYGEHFPNAKDNQSLNLVEDQVLFKTPLDMSYHCNRPQQISLKSVDNTGSNATITVSKLQFEAFHSKHNTKFSIARDCDAIDTPDIVPIAVGCALILLIVIVLIAYLAGRRSSRSQGYVSM